MVCSLLLQLWCVLAYSLVDVFFAQINDGYANGDGNFDSLTLELNPDEYWHYITLAGEFVGLRLEITEQ
jgi:hypothetical protein